MAIVVEIRSCYLYYLIGVSGYPPGWLTAWEGITLTYIGHKAAESAEQVGPLFREANACWI